MFHPQVCNRIVAQAALFQGTFKGGNGLSLLTSSSPSLPRNTVMKALGQQRRCQQGVSVMKGDHDEVRWNREPLQAEGITCKQFPKHVYHVCLLVHRCVFAEPAI